ncbi:MAG: RimK-like ATPgrasp N-terminal domain-containing protein, partial [Planctomycetota bacterium]
MPTLIIVDNPTEWPFKLDGIEIVAAKSYITNTEYHKIRGAKVFNLCRSYRYQSIGYYVSLLAAARGHRAIPSVSTIQDFKSQAIIRIVSEDLDELIQKILAPIQSKEFTLSIYFGKNMAKKYDRLSLQLFNQFEAPLLRAQFAFDGQWYLQS